MFTQAIMGMGATFGVGDGTQGGSTAYALVGEINTIKAPGLSRDAIDATNINSPDLFREFIAGLMESTDCSINFNYVPGTVDDLYTAFLAGAGDFEITYPGATIKLQFQGIPTSWEPGTISPDKMTGDFTVKVSGKPVIVAV